MKKYTHKSGHFIATATMYGEYEVVLLAPYGTDINRTIYTVPVQCRDLIENSLDWTKMVEEPLNDYYSKQQIEFALRNLLADISSLNTEAQISHYRNLMFEEAFFHYLRNTSKKDIKKKIVSNYKGHGFRQTI